MSTKVLLKDPSDYPDSLKYVLDIVTINETPNVVGSAKYMAAKYSGDVDVFESVNVDMNKKDAVELYSNLISTMAIDIMMTDRKILFNGSKAGADVRFQMKDEMTKYNRKRFANNLCSNNLINHCEHVEFDKMNEEEFKDKLKKFHVLRWTLRELATKKKHLRGGKVMTLNEAICMPDLVKIDVISYIEGRFQSVEVVYLFKYRNKAIQDLGDYEERMRSDFDKYSSPEHYNPLKLMKRIFAFSRVIDCGEVIKLFTPLYSADMSALNQIVADIEIIRDLVEKQSNPPINIMLLEVNGFKKRLLNHNQPDVCNKLESITDIWIEWKNTGYFDSELFLSIINELETELKVIIFDLSKTFMDKITAKFNTIECRPIDLKIV
uniref:Nucleotidyl transferase n=1 Tax=Pithovirus LCPAC401 TaxID=2506595 RepID=A0A481ZBA4_9VIRU|nr:MAG: nucleotidyl transferase [Pithovirus LCPAC401]